MRMKIEIEISRKMVNMAKAMFAAVCDDEGEVAKIEGLFDENAEATLCVPLDSLDEEKSVELQLGLVAMAMAEKMRAEEAERSKEGF